MHRYYCSHQIDAIHIDSDRLKHEWLLDQTKLVATAAATEDLLETNNEYKARSGILDRRKARVLREASTNTAEAKRLHANIQVLHIDEQRLKLYNVLILSPTP
jgi:hypothetical protein